MIFLILFTRIVPNMEFTGIVLVPTSVLLYNVERDEPLIYLDDVPKKQDKNKEEMQIETKPSPKEFPRYFTDKSNEEESNTLLGSRYTLKDQNLYRTTLDTTEQHSNEQNGETILIRKIHFAKTLSEDFTLNVVELPLPSNLCYNMRNVSTSIQPTGVDKDFEKGDDNDVPAWFSEGVFFCFQWYYDKYIWQCDANGLFNPGLCIVGKQLQEFSYKYNEDQCGVHLKSPLCVPVGQITDPYRDDTDVRPGGCRMSWGVMSRKPSPAWFSQVELCFQWFSDTNGDAGQCGGGIDEMVCAKVGTYTPYYFDDTDERRDGCNMRWKLSVPTKSPAWLLTLKFCFHYEADDRDKKQCNNGGDKTSFCVGVNSWTTYYRDNTNLGKGGCRLQWGLVL